MNRRTWAFLAIAIVAAGSLTLGTSGFSAAEIDRAVSISVADGQASGFVPLADPGAQGTHPAPEWVTDRSQLRENPVTVEDQHVPLFVVHNRFETPMDVDARVVRGGLTDVSDIDSRSLDPGETGVVSGTVACGGYAGPATVDLTVTAATQSVTAHIDYQVTVVCASQTPTPSADRTSDSV